MSIRIVVMALIAMVVLAACAGGASTGSIPPGTDPAGGALRILTPSSGDVVETATVTFAGTAPAGARVVHDIPLAPDDEVIASDGTWTLDVELDEGANDIVLRLGDDEAPAISVRITYRPATAAATPEPTPEPVAEATPEPTPEPTPAPTPKPTKVEYKKLSDRSWAKLVKSPDAYLGRAYQVWGCIWQFDAATGPDSFLAQASNKKRTYWWTDGDNAMFTGDEGRLADFVEDDIVVMNVVSQGSYSYDTQAGGNTTVPIFQVTKITRKGDCG